MRMDAKNDLCAKIDVKGNVEDDKNEEFDRDHLAVEVADELHQRGVLSKDGHQG